MSGQPWMAAAWAHVRDRMRGRVFAAFDMIWQSGRLASLALGGIAADTLGAQAVYLLGGLLLPAGAAGLAGLRAIRRHPGRQAVTARPPPPGRRALKPCSVAQVSKGLGSGGHGRRDHQVSTRPDTGQALRAAALRAATGSQPSCFQTILPEAEVSTNHGWSCTPYPSAMRPVVSRAPG